MQTQLNKQSDPGFSKMSGNIFSIKINESAAECFLDLGGHVM